MLVLIISTYDSIIS